MLERGNDRLVVARNSLIIVGTGAAILRPKRAALKDRQADRRADGPELRAGLDQVAEAKRLQADQGAQIDRWKESGARHLDAASRSLDPLAGSHNIRTPAQQVRCQPWRKAQWG